MSVLSLRPKVEPKRNCVIVRDANIMNPTKAKNTICLWFNKDALDAARFYAATFPNSEVTAIHKAPGDYPDGKEGDVLTV